MQQSDACFNSIITFSVTMRSVVIASAGRKHMFRTVQRALLYMAQYSPLFLQNEILDKHAGFAAIRQIGINQVLGTDMKKHFDITSRFQVSFCLLPP